MVRTLKQPWWEVAVCTLTLGYSLALGPFRAPDEYAHFFRAYQISDGSLIATRGQGGLLGASLPVSLARVMHRVGGYPNVPPLQVDRKALVKSWHVPLKAGHREFAHFPGAALHSPLIYSPAVLGIAFGHLIKAGPLLLFYLGRVSNALICGCLVGQALSRTASLTPSLASIALLPMSLSQIGTLTADALTFAIVFSWFAEVWHARSEKDRGFSRWKWFLFAAALSQLRFPYPLLAFLILAVPRHQLGQTRTKQMRFLLTFATLLLLPFLGWFAIVQHLQVPLRPLVDTNPPAQLHFALSHPGKFIAITGMTITHLGMDYWREMIGVLGWLQLSLPDWVLAALTVCLLVTNCSSDTKRLGLTIPLRISAGVLGLCGLLLTFLLAYMAWNGVGAPQIEGWQGRYSIPLLPLLAFACASSFLCRFASLTNCALIFSVITNVGVIVLLARITYF